MQFSGLDIDPVIKVIVGDQSHYTTIKKSSNNPFYNEVQHYFFVIGAHSMFFSRFQSSGDGASGKAVSYTIIHKTFYAKSHFIILLLYMYCLLQLQVLASMTIKAGLLVDVRLSTECG